MSVTGLIASDRVAVSTPQNTMRGVEDLRAALGKNDLVLVGQCVNNLLGQGTMSLAQSVAGDKRLEPLFVALGLLEALNTAHFQDEELQQSLAKAARIFLELTYMKSALEKRPLLPNMEAKIKMYVDGLLLRYGEDLANLRYELICCHELCNLRGEGEAKEYLSQILRAFTHKDPSKITTDLLGILPSILQRGHTTEYLGSLFISWIKDVAINDLNFFRSVREGVAPHLSCVQIAQAYVEVLGHLAANGQANIQLEALREDLGVFFFCSIEDEAMWKVRMQAFEILFALTSHPSIEVVNIATERLLKGWTEKSDPRVSIPLDSFNRARVVSSEKINERLEALRRDWEGRKKKNGPPCKSAFIGENTSAGVLRDPPPEFLCPIGGNIMLDPIVADDGGTYDRANFIFWMKLVGKSPLTKKTISSRATPSQDLKNAIENFRASYNTPKIDPLKFEEQNVSGEGEDLFAQRLPSMRDKNTPIDIPGTLNRLDLAAKFGSPLAQYYMGLTTIEDIGVEKRELLKARAKTGDVFARNLLSLWDHHLGLYPKDNVTAAELFLKAAQAGIAIAQTDLGTCYRDGLGVTIDKTQAIYWYRKAADQGYADAQYQLGLLYANGFGVDRSFAEAVFWYKKAAEQGHIDAQANLGYCYDYGLGIEQDFMQGAFWYRKAAEQGSAFAAANLGFCFATGQGVAQDDDQSVFWTFKGLDMEASRRELNRNPTRMISCYELAASQGYAAAQNELGNCYSYGQGVPKNDDEAIDWYMRASGQGYAPALCNMGRCYENGQGIDQDYSKAFSYFRRAAEKGNARAQYHMGKCYFMGQGVEQDFAEAVYWFHHSSFGGDIDGDYNLARCYDLGYGIAKNRTAQAVLLYQRAAEQGHVDAQFYLGFCYFTGRGVTKHVAQGALWYRKAAILGHADAQFNLGICHTTGQGVIKDFTKALYWYRRASEQGHPEAQSALANLPEVPTLLAVQNTSDWVVSIDKENWASPHLIKNLPPYPVTLKDFLAGPCPLWGGKTAAETHIVVPLFPFITLDGSSALVPRTLKNLGDLDKSSGGTGFAYIGSKTLEKYGDEPAGEFCFAVIVKEAFPGSIDRSYDEQRWIVESKGYEVPSVLDMATAILWEHKSTGKRLFSDDPPTFTRCRGKIGSRNLIVGNFSVSGPFVCETRYDLGNNYRIGFGCIGMSGVRKFRP